MDSKILIECDIQTSPKCKGRYTKGWRSVLKTRKKHDGKDVCIYCHNKTFNTGSKNGAFKYRKNESFFNEIDSELKAYLLGLVAGDGSIEGTGKRVTLHANASDIESLELFKKSLSPEAPIMNDEGCYNVRINSTNIVSDICQHLQIDPGSKCNLLSLPPIPNEHLWHFIRGLIDSDGWISDPSKGCTSPRCKLTSASIKLLTDLQELCNQSFINSSLGHMNLYFTGIHAQNFMNTIYDDSRFYLTRKYDRYLIWKTWVPHYGTVCRPRKNSTN